MKYGTITQVSGPVVDVAFESGYLPKIREAMTVSVNGTQRVMEVSQHVGHDTVRCIMLAGSEGLSPRDAGMRPRLDHHRAGRRTDAGQDVQRPGKGHRRQGGAAAGGASATASTARRLTLRTSSRSARFWRPASRSSTCWSRIRRAARSDCLAARAVGKTVLISGADPQRRDGAQRLFGLYRCRRAQPRGQRPVERDEGQRRSG